MGAQKQDPSTEGLLAAGMGGSVGGLYVASAEGHNDPEDCWRQGHASCSVSNTLNDPGQCCGLQSTTMIEIKPKMAKVNGCLRQTLVRACCPPGCRLLRSPGVRAKAGHRSQPWQPQLHRARAAHLSIPCLSAVRTVSSPVLHAWYFRCLRTSCSCCRLFLVPLRSDSQARNCQCLGCY